MLTAYFQCANGVSGDMVLGALVDAGAPLDAIQQAVNAVLPDREITLIRQEVKRAGISATLIKPVGADDPAPPGAGHGHTPLSVLIEQVQESGLPASVTEPSLRVLNVIGEAESRVHAAEGDDIALAELGAADTLVDIVGAVVGLAELGVETAYASGLPLATGRVRTQHGVLPVPAPGVLEIMRMSNAAMLPPPEGAADGELTGEIVTPTGAAIITTLARPTPPPAPASVQAVGYGAGTKDPPGRANIVTVVIGAAADATVAARDMVMVETTIDDMNPEHYEHVRERLAAVGARDVWLTPVQMKKGRPGVILSAVALPEMQAALAAAMLRETTTLGVRATPVTRYEASRESVTVQTPFGPARVKVKRLGEGGEIIGIAPEYEDCRRIAREASLPIQRVYDAARRSAEDALL